jgi:DNA replication protein DnaC
MTLEVTISKLNAMRLNTMASSLKERLMRNDHQDVSLEDMFGLIVDDEWLARENRKLTRRLQQAKFKAQATLEDIDYQFKRGLVKSRLLDLSTLKWIVHHQDVLIVGPTGIGKSFIAQALGHQACMRGYTTHFIRASNLFHQFHISYADGSFGCLLAKLSKFDVLIIDDC